MYFKEEEVTEEVKEEEEGLQEIFELGVCLCLQMLQIALCELLASGHCKAWQYTQLCGYCSKCKLMYTAIQNNFAEE